jgi:tetratricopeptide (TPR) repeat protein
MLLAACASSAKSSEQVAQKRKIDIDAASKSWDDAVKEQDWKRAADAYTNVIINYPDYIGAYNYRGTAYLCLGMKEQAINDFNEVFKIEPDNWSAKQNILLASVPTAAVIVYQRSLQTTKNSTRIEALTEAIQLYPSFFHAYNNRGNAYFAKYMIDEAEADLNKAYELWPDHYMVSYNLARIYRFNGDYDKALEYLERSLKINPDYVYTQRVLDEVRKLSQSERDREKRTNYLKGYFVKYYEILDGDDIKWFRDTYPEVYKARFED